MLRGPDKPITSSTNNITPPISGEKQPSPGLGELIITYSTHLCIAGCFDCCGSYTVFDSALMKVASCNLMNWILSNQVFCHTHLWFRTNLCDINVIIKIIIIKFQRGRIR